jgi:hypothetical protein
VIRVALLTDDELMPWWVAAGLDGRPGEVCDPAVPEMPGWVREAPLALEEPRCDCGCSSRHDAPDPVDEEVVRWAVPGVWGPEPVGLAPSVGELVSTVQHATSLLAQVDPALLSPDRALGEASALAEVQHCLRMVQLARTKDVKDRELYEHLGYRSLAAWQRDVAPDAPASDRTLSRRLGTLVHLGAALSERRVSFAAANQVGAAMSKVAGQLDARDGLIDGLPGEEVVAAVVTNVVDLVCRDRFGLRVDATEARQEPALLATLEVSVERILVSGGTQAERVEQAMVLLAQHVSARSLPGCLEELVLQLVPSVLEDREKAAQEKRALSLRPNTDGTWDLEATLTPEAGEQLFTALAAEARRDPANPLDTHARAQARDAAEEQPAWEARAEAELGERFLPDADRLVPRSRSKRLHDALARLLTRYLEGGLGGLSGKVPVQVTAMISAQTIEGAPGAPTARSASGRPLARSLLRRWWCDAHVTTLVMSRGWMPLGLVHTARTITATELKAVRAQFGNRCPGIDCCPAAPDPLTPLVPHHVRLHSVHGQTSLDETLLVCDRLHQDLHVGKRTIRLRDGRLITEDGYLDVEAEARG